MSDTGGEGRRRSWRERHVKEFVCTICERKAPFCWCCPCGFQICEACFSENAWGLTCNNITWECPECGAFRSF